MSSHLPWLYLTLLRLTLLLSLGWGAGLLLRRRHPRWRVILWRALLCFVLVSPLAAAVRFAFIRVPIQTPSWTVEPLPELGAAKGSAGQAAPANSAAAAQPVTVGMAMSAAVSSMSASVSRPRSTIPWETVALVAWAIGAALAAGRLARLQARLTRLKASSAPAAASIQELAAQIAEKVEARRPIEIRVSDSVSSPFACGVARRAILLPRRLLADLEESDLSVLLAHEMAHFRGSDLLWCVAWRWMQAALWFHPLAWKIPGAHSLACEQEADRIVAERFANRDAYSQSLARLVLRVAATPRLETWLALNGASQIAQRLHYLARGGGGSWTWKYSAAATALAAGLFMGGIGCQVTPAGDDAEAAVEFETVPIRIVNTEGKPIAGATVRVSGFRVRGIHAADGYGWRSEQFGPNPVVMTDPDGRAELRYPVMAIPEEKEYTGALTLVVTHPDYCDLQVSSYPVKGLQATTAMTGGVFHLDYTAAKERTPPAIMMTNGITLEVSAYFGPSHERVAEFIPNLSLMSVNPTNWQHGANGALVFHRLAPGTNLLQLMGRLPSGQIVYSDTMEIAAEIGKPQRLDVELKPGIRLEGRIDERVPRPIKNGKVMMDVRPKEFPALTVVEDWRALFQKYGDANGWFFWHSQRPLRRTAVLFFQ